jgi:glycosyltransferase involved in cell wall biosynthesis
VRVTLCSDACEIGGAERYLLDLAEDLSAGHEVRVLLSDCQRNGPLRMQLRSRAVHNLSYLPSGIYPRRRALSIFRRAREVFSRGDSDLVHFSLHHADSCRYWIAAAASLGIPYAITEHAISPGFLHASRLTPRMKRRAYEGAKQVVFVSESARSQVEADLGRLSNACVIHPGIRDEEVAGGAPARRDVVFMGRWSIEKDPIAAVRCFLKASSDIADWRLLVYGAGPLESSLIRVSKDPSAARVKVCGWSARPLEDLRQAGVFLQTSRWENSPYVILDAMASGLTVVAYAVGDVASMLDFGNAGLPVDADDSEGLVQALRLAMTDEALRSRFADTGPERVRSVYSRAEMVTRTAALYRAAVA